MTKLATPLLAIAAYSGTGKTTLLKQLIPLLRERHIRVGLIKHTHHDMDIDKPGKTATNCVRPAPTRPWSPAIDVGR
ncbi:Molybdopterin-guanine dinucleotide biosynthesis protein B [Serratia rubidaea]|uniref:Molybdopterin-guanine dinucleotide biosynthesis protein B n=1 Tax=Serratia rubidaea TaxID=61652 RepID=A0A3S4H6G9_SERRU|nr:Molybdopterin-guanine dinucleotide biosynthesis protein B [Serratia rubidaea]